MADHTRFEGREVLTYKHKHDKDRSLTVYDGTGEHDALRTDPAWERQGGEDKAEPIAPKTAKVGPGADGLESDAEKRQAAAQAGVSNDPEVLGKLSGSKAAKVAKES